MTTQIDVLDSDERPIRRDEPQAYDDVGATSTVPAADTSGDGADLGTSYLPDQTSAQAGERWQRIQAEFVDDPRKSVAEAHALVSELMQRVVDTFTRERGELERQWSGGDSVSTEDMRICMQRYRAFFSRLLPFEDRARGARPE